MKTSTATGAANATGQVSVGATATILVAPKNARRGLIVVNHGATDVFLGGSDVTASTGLLLAGVKGTALGIPTNDALYGITGGGNQTVSFMDVSD
jgi:hypothetical protein